jgi:hypothetical protein
MAPAWSDYRKTVYYNTYDLTAQLAKGCHRLEVLLGNGFYHERGRRYHKLNSNYGPLTLPAAPRRDLPRRQRRHFRERSAAGSGAAAR